MICFIYASQYGFTRGLAERIYQQESQQHPDQFRFINAGQLRKLDFYHNCSRFLYLTSTFYRGGNPEDGQEFINLLRNDGTTSQWMGRHRYAILGVGDNQYSQYQGAALAADTLFAKNGASRVVGSFFIDRQLPADPQIEAALEWVAAAVKQLTE